MAEGPLRRRVHLGLELERAPDPPLRVSGVTPDGTADRAGIEPGDLLIAIAGKAIGSEDELSEVVRRLDAGTKVSERAFARRPELRISNSPWSKGVPGASRTRRGRKYPTRSASSCTRSSASLRLSMRSEQSRVWILMGAIALALASCSDDDEAARGSAGKDGGRDGAAGSGAGTGGSSGIGAAGGTTGSAGTSGAAGSAGAVGSAGSTGSGGAAGSAGAGGSAGADAATDSVSDAVVDVTSDRPEASDSSVDAGSGDAGSGDACADCWIRDKFPDGGPGTITVTGRIRKNDNVCVIVYGGGQCQAQNTPPCNPQSGQTTATLDLTLDAAGKLTVEAPYQDMCAPDYFCAVSGPGCLIPTSYTVPTDTTFSYVPRSTDYCRRDLNGAPHNVSHQVNVRISGRSLVIDQLCTTRMLNISSLVTDVRNWTTTIDL